MNYYRARKTVIGLSVIDEPEIKTYATYERVILKGCPKQRNNDKIECWQTAKCCECKCAEWEAANG